MTKIWLDHSYVFFNVILCYLVQPQTGVLGTHKKAVVFDMIQKDKVYPDGYFWKVGQGSMANKRQMLCTVCEKRMDGLVTNGRNRCGYKFSKRHRNFGIQ